jgi:hypothetical protein
MGEKEGLAAFDSTRNKQVANILGRTLSLYFVMAGVNKFLV